MLISPLQWRHNGRGSVSNHQSYDCFLNRLFRRRSKKISKLRVTGLCAENSPWPVNSPHKWPVTRKMFPFDDVIMAVEFHGWISSSLKLHIIAFKHFELWDAGCKTPYWLMNSCHWEMKIDDSQRTLLYFWSEHMSLRYRIDCCKFFSQLSMSNSCIHMSN